MISVLGAGGHAKVIVDILKKNGEKNISVFDDDENKIGKESILGILVTGAIKDIDGSNSAEYFIVGIGNNRVRKKIVEKLDGNYGIAIHPTAIIGEDVIIGEGTVVMANAVINSGTRIGKHCIINTGATIDHDCVLDDYVHISPGVHIGGTVKIGQLTWIGLGCSLKNNISIGANVIVGVGGVVINDIIYEGIYAGVPVQQIKGGSK